ncbi:hypothetical protein [Gilliamella sp. CG33]|uniref:hypothetical protein n=1 Tax=Gilliamella sp. CG33 TaxID=3351506 RepID=UPI0039878C23
MSTVLILLIVLTIGMARKARPRRRRRMGRYIRGNIDLDLSLGTLASKTAVLDATEVVTEKALVSSIVATYSLSNMTAAADVGPIEVGVAHSDYSLAEIEGYLERTVSWSEGDLISKEISSRKVRRVGVFDFPSPSGSGSYSLNDGKAIKTKLNWILTTGQGLNFWYYNQGTQALATTDPNGNIVGHANIWPR